MSIVVINKYHGKLANDIIIENIKSLYKKRQKRHEFRILSCYIDLDLIKNITSQLIKEVRLTDIYLSFNFAEIYKYGPKNTKAKLLSIKNNLNKKDINFEWISLASSNFVHSKGYALMQRTGDDISGGVVLTTSANFTNPGFTGKNIELGYISTKKKDIRSFESIYDYLWDTLGCTLDSAIFKQEKYLLKYAVLSSGLFLHKWSGSLSQQVGIKYELTPHAKEKGSIAPELAALGFQSGDTFTRQVLNMDRLPQKEVPSLFITRFTIETYLGRWCPADAWNLLSKSFEGATEFIQQFQEVTKNSTLEQVTKEALAVQDELVKKNLIKPVKNDYLEKWANRILELRSNYRLLERFYTGYDVHALPYSAEHKTDIEELFNNLEETITLSKATNIAKDKARSAIDRSDPDLIKLSNDEESIVREIIDNN